MNDLTALLTIISVMESPPSARVTCSLWSFSKEKESKKSKKKVQISGLNSYYGDWGMDEEMFAKSGAFVAKEQAIISKKVVKKEQKVTKLAKKVLKFSTKK